MQRLAIILISLTLCFAGCGEARDKKGENQTITAESEPQLQASRPQAIASNRVSSTADAFQSKLEKSKEDYRRSSGDDETGSSPPVVNDADTASLAKISTVQASTQAVDRKIIRNADVTLELDSPTDGLRHLTTIAEAFGGFVVTSDFKHTDSGPQGKPSQSVNVVIRVPASQFAPVLEQVRSSGNRLISEKVSGQDVSEEYLDLEARLRTKKALEAQFLEIMKQARKVSDALEVQSQLGDVRTEIERLEGRRRFLENQSAMSTITVTMQMPQPIVAATSSGFSHSIKQAFGDAVDVAVSIVLTAIQAVIVLIPIAVLIGLPLWLLWRVVRRRIHWGAKQPSIVPEA